MIATTGASFDVVQALMRGLREQARASRNGESHPHGWGLLDASESGLRYLARRSRDIVPDPDFDRVVQRARGARGFLLAHVRQASAGRVAVPNTHPFLANGYAFCHNGTIHELPASASETYEGETDSERFFRRLLRAIEREPHVPTAVETVVDEVTRSCRFTSLTFLLTDGRTLWGYRGVGPLALEETGDPDRALAAYGLALARREGQLFIAQEPTHLGPLDGWIEVPDGHLLEWRAESAPRVRPLRVAAVA